MAAFDAALLSLLALALIWIVAHLFDSSDSYFGAIVVVLFGGIFMFLGWLPLGSFMFMMSIAVLVYLRSHYRFSYGAGGGAGALIWNIAAFVLAITLAISLSNGLGLFSTNLIANQNNTFSTYSIEKADTVFEPIKNPSMIDSVIQSVSYPIKLLTNTLGMIWDTFSVAPQLMTLFGVPEPIADIISAFFYMLMAIAIFVLIFRPFQSPEV